MAKILDSSTITNPAYKFMELRKGFLINGQYYLKENMQPVPFNTVNYNSANFTDSGRSLLSLDRNIRYYNIFTFGATDNTKSSICYDSLDEKICYVYLEANSYKWLCKFKEDNNRCDLLNVVSIETPSGSTYSKSISIYEKDEEIRVTISGNGSVSIMYRYAKFDLALLGSANIDSLGVNTTYAYDQYSEIYRDSAGIFSYKSGYGSNSYTFYNDSNSVKTTVNMSDVDPCYGSTSNNRNRFNYQNLYKKTDNTMSVIHLAADKLATGKCNFKAGYIVEYDLLLNKFTKTEVPVEVEASVLEKYPDGVYMASEYWTSDVWYKTINGKTYTILYLRDSYYVGKLSRAYIFEHVVSELDPKLKLKLIKIQEFPLGQSGNIIHYNDESKLRFYGYRRVSNGASLFNSIYCYELDESNLEFVKTFNLDGEIREFGFDRDRNLYVLWNNNELSRFNSRTASNFNARFENGLYEYQGEDIATNLVISTTNLEGQFVEKQVVLDLKGNAKFTGNGTKTITLTTSSIGETKVPITITGAGALSIFPKVKL